MIAIASSRVRNHCKWNINDIMLCGWLTGRSLLRILTHRQDIDRALKIQLTQNYVPRSLWCCVVNCGHQRRLINDIADLSNVAR